MDHGVSARAVARSCLRFAPLPPSRWGHEPPASARPYSTPGSHELSITLAPSENALNAVDALHGGVIATLLDVAAYISVASHLADHEEAVTIAFAASYFAAAETGEELHAVGSFLRRSRHLAFATAELRGQSTVLALASVTKAVRSKRSSYCFAPGS